MTVLSAGQALSIRAAVELFETLAGGVGVDGEELPERDLSALGDGTAAVELDEDGTAEYALLVSELLTGLYVPGDEQGTDVDWAAIVEAGVALGLRRERLPRIV